MLQFNCKINDVHVGNSLKFPRTMLTIRNKF